MRHWAANAVIYQVYPRSFQDHDGDGIGDLRGLAGRLDHLADLGVDAIWLSPIHPSPNRDFGYDISHYTAVDSVFGTLADFDALVARAHALGLRLLLDYVPNHTSDQHRWFLESRSSRDSAKRDWYIWRDPGAGGSPPNNWVEESGGSVWEWDEPTGQFYLHSHYASQPDLNWRNPEVEREMFDVLRFWLDRGVDGFRVDVPHLLMKDPALRDNPPNPDPQPNPYDRQHPAFHQQLHLHDRQHPDLHDVFRRMRAVVDAYGRDRLLIAELEVGPWDTWRLYFGERLDEFQVPFSFQLIETPWQAGAIQRVVEELQAAVPDGAWPNWVLGNHDRSRIATRYGPDGARLAAVLLLSLPGTATLYYGDELGMPDADIPPKAWLDPLGRDVSRTPMPWDDSVNHGFCPPTAQPWLPFAHGVDIANVRRARDKPASLLNLYRRLIELRYLHPALRDGDLAPLPLAAGEAVAYWRRSADARLAVILNLTDREQRVAGCEPGALRPLLSTHSVKPPPTIDLTSVRLRPYEGLLGEALDL